MSITEISIKRPSLIIVLFTVLILGGLLSYSKLSYELLPSFSSPTLIITTPYPGASPADVEQSVTKNIEDVVTGLSQLKNTISQSYEGMSVITAEFKTGTDIDEKQQEAQRKINNILSQLPENVKTPSIIKMSPSDAPIMELTAVAKMGEKEFYDLVDKQILPLLQQIDGVGEINILGGLEREVKVNVDKDKLTSYGIALMQVTQAINSANLDFPTGKVKSKDDQITVRLVGKFTSVDQIKNLILVSLPNGASIKVSDIADVVDDVKDQKTINRFNGIDGIGLQIKKQSDANAVDISEQVKEQITKIETQYASQEVRIIIADDTADFTLEAADAVTHDLIIAIILVALVILVFLHSLRDSLIVMIAIPASLISTFIAMYLLGYTLNLMTLLAMSLVIGILVDDSIVVLENIHRHVAMGKDKRTAALEGRAEIGFSALAITLVDVVVFVPIALVNTTIGDILRQFSMTVVVATLMSLLVSFTLTPFLYSRFGKKANLNPKNLLHKPIFWFETFFERLRNWYVRKLEWVLVHKKISVIAVILMFVITGYISSLGILGQELINGGDRGKFKMELEYDKSTTLAENNLRTRTIEDYLRVQPHVVSIYANVGGAGMGMGGVAGIGSENKTELTVELVKGDKRDVTTEQYMITLRDEIQSKFIGVKLNTSVIGMMSGSEKPIQIVLSSEDKEALMKTSAKLKNTIEHMPGANDVSVSVEEGNPELNINIDRDKMARLGLNMGQVGATLQNAYTGNTDAKYRDGLNEYDINIRLDAFDRNNLTDVAGFIFQNAKGEKIALSQFATINQSSGPSMLERKNRRNSVTIKSNILGITSGTLAANIDAAIANDPLPASVDMKWSGDVERQTESFSALGMALLAALVLFYLIMVALYDSFVHPFVVFFSIPVALIGALLALNLTMSSMSIFTMLGMIMLLGLVSKNGILLVDFANKEKEKGMDTFNALLEAGRERLRPILMTTTAMVLGMLPIALATGAGAEWKNGLAIVLIGGLISSLMLTVFVVPIAYMGMEKLISKVKRKKSLAEKNAELSKAIPTN